jgi:hypothetical protein
MMTEWDWYEKTEELLHRSSRGEWNKLLYRAVEVYQHYKINEDVTEEQLLEALHGLLRKLEGFPPTWLAIAGPDGDIETPDDIWIEPAWNVIEVQRIWDNHDGRNFGTAVVGVYVWNRESNTWTRDKNWGIMGQEGKTGPADRDDEHDRIC